MHPTLLDWPITIHSYGFMLLVAFYAAWMLGHWRAKKEGVPTQRIADLLIWCVVAGVVGARVAHVIIFRHDFDSPWEYFKVWEGGLVFYGGLAGAAAVLAWRIRRWKLPLGKLADLIAPSIALGLAFGRIGCFLYGCCWGDVVDKDHYAWLRPIAVEFPGRFVKIEDPLTGRVSVVREGSPAFVAHVERGWIATPKPNEFPQGASELEHGSLPVLPTQLMSSVVAAIICVCLNLAYRFKRLDGEVFFLMGVIYSMNRFVLEILRDDTSPVMLGLTVSQVLSVLFFVGCAGMLIGGRLAKRKRAGNE